MTATNSIRMESPVGPLVLVSSGIHLTEIRFGDQGFVSRQGDPAPILAEARDQLEAYFRGRLRDFHLEFELGGTEFQRTVWRALAGIPYGETISYGELARRIGNPTASRAVGAANGRNPLPILLPCHRVIGSGGQLTGYGGGLPIKTALLELEKGKQVGGLFGMLAG